MGEKSFQAIDSPFQLALNYLRNERDMKISLSGR